MAESFINAYVDKFKPEIIEMYPCGAPKVPELGKLLSLLYKRRQGIEKTYLLRNMERWISEIVLYLFYERYD